MRPITDWMFKNEMVQTCTEPISNKQWCENECARMGIKNHFIQERPSGLIRIVTNLRKKPNQKEKDRYKSPYNLREHRPTP